MAAAISDAMLQQARLPAIIASAGTLRLQGRASPQEVLTACAELGLDVSGHRSQPLTLSLIQHAQIIIVMEEAHSEVILRQAPGAEHKIIHLGDYSDPPGDVFDPIGQDLAVFRQSRDHILAALQRLLPTLARRLAALSS